MSLNPTNWATLIKNHPQPWLRQYRWVVGSGLVVGLSLLAMITVGVGLCGLPSLPAKKVGGGLIITSYASSWLWLWYFWTNHPWKKLKLTQSQHKKLLKTIMICYALVFGVVLGFVLLVIWAREVIVFQITANNNQKKINNLYQPKIS